MFDRGPSWRRAHHYIPSILVGTLVTLELSVCSGGKPVSQAMQPVSLAYLGCTAVQLEAFQLIFSERPAESYHPVWAGGFGHGHPRAS